MQAWALLQAQLLCSRMDTKSLCVCAPVQLPQFHTCNTPLQPEIGHYRPHRKQERGKQKEVGIKLFRYVNSFIPFYLISYNALPSFPTFVFVTSRAITDQIIQWNRRKQKSTSLFFLMLLKLDTFKDASEHPMSVWAFHREITDKILSKKIKMLLEPLKTERAVSPASSNCVWTEEQPVTNREA